MIGKEYNKFDRIGTTLINNKLSIVKNQKSPLKRLFLPLYYKKEVRRYVGCTCTVQYVLLPLLDLFFYCSLFHVT